MDLPKDPTPSQSLFLALMPPMKVMFYVVHEYAFLGPASCIELKIFLVHVI